MNLLRKGRISSSTKNKDVVALLEKELETPISSRVDEFEKRLDTLIEDFSDLSCSDIADSLDYYSSMYQQKANRDNSNG